MKAFQITDIKQFMSKLLVKETFDIFLLSEANISIGNTYQVNGQINKEFYTSDESDSQLKSSYSLWSTVKPFVYGLIKGNKTPVFMKIVFILSSESILNIIHEYNISIFEENINGLFINIKYSENILTIVTGTSMNIFTMDKSLDTAFDTWFKNYLLSESIDFEEV